MPGKNGSTDARGQPWCEERRKSIRRSSPLKVISRQGSGGTSAEGPCLSRVPRAFPQAERCQQECGAIEGCGSRRQGAVEGESEILIQVCAA